MSLTSYLAALRDGNEDGGRLLVRLGDDRRVAERRLVLPAYPRQLTILISLTTPAPYRYTGLALVHLISASQLRFHHHGGGLPPIS